jgi:hypothetical protein
LVIGNWSNAADPPRDSDQPYFVSLIEFMMVTIVFVMPSGASAS